MTTDDLQLRGFLHWTAFNRHEMAELLRKVHSEFGVYVVRATKAVKRIDRESDIVYIGSACNQNGLRGRISLNTFLLGRRRSRTENTSPHWGIMRLRDWLASGGEVLDTHIVSIELLKPTGGKCQMAFILPKDIETSAVPVGTEIWLRHSQ